MIVLNKLTAVEETVERCSFKIVTGVYKITFKPEDCEGISQQKWMLTLYKKQVANYRGARAGKPCLGHCRLVSEVM